MEQEWTMKPVTADKPAMRSAEKWLNEFPINPMRSKSDEIEGLDFIRAIQQDATTAQRATDNTIVQNFWLTFYQKPWTIEQIDAAIASQRAEPQADLKNLYERLDARRDRYREDFGNTGEVIGMGYALDLILAMLAAAPKPEEKA
jgi:hypothetical protein